jgi:hypothetical protein
MDKEATEAQRKKMVRIRRVFTVKKEEFSIPRFRNIPVFYVLSS